MQKVLLAALSERTPYTPPEKGRWYDRPRSSTLSALALLKPYRVPLFSHKIYKLASLVEMIRSPVAQRPVGSTVLC